MTGDGGLVEVQATAERTPLSRAHLDELLALAATGHRGPARGAGRRDRLGRAHGRLVLATRNAHKLREFRRLLPDAALEPLPDDGRAAARDGRDVRGERADQGARGRARDRRARDRRRLRASRPRRSAAAPASAPPATPATTPPTPRTSPSCAPRRRAGSGLRYVCAVAYVEPGEAPRIVEGTLRGPHGRGAARRGRLRLRPGVRPRRRRRRAARWPSSPTPRRTAISHRGRAVREAAAWLPSAR